MQVSMASALARCSAAVRRLKNSAKLSGELPICSQVYQIAYEGKSPKAAVLDLMVRSPKSELV